MIQPTQQNLEAVGVSLPQDALARLNEVSEPPADFINRQARMAPTFMHGGISVNGVTPPPSPIAPKADSPRY